MSESSGDGETTTDQVYLRHIRMELQNITAAIVDLTAAVRAVRSGPPPPSIVDDETDVDDEPDIDDEPPPDDGPPGSRAVITEYD